MLSILIPIYNYDSTRLVKELHAQACEANIPFEIICIDDASRLYKDKNAEINLLKNCRYEELETNIGRSRIRNLLAEKSIFDNLLFLDCDVEILHPDYIKTYLKMSEHYDIISGGRIYTNSPPQQREYYFHWIYGTRRETKSSNFMSNNFMMKKALWSTVSFNEEITLYGHEDTLFQIELEKNGIQIQFIDNPVVHIGLDSDKAFLKKTRESIKNLQYLYDNKLIDDTDLNRFSVLKTFKRIEKLKLNKLLKLFFPPVRALLEKNFSSRHPNLFFFGVYKLMFLSYINRKTR